MPLTLQGQASPPDTPPSSHVSLYFDTVDGTLKTKDSSGTIVAISHPAPLSANSTSSHSTTSTTYVSINSMSLVLNPGVWNINFHTSIQVNSTSTELAYVSLFDGESQITHSEKQFHNMSAHPHAVTYPVSTHTIITVSSGTKTITARFKSGSGTSITSFARIISAVAE